MKLYAALLIAVLTALLALPALAGEFTGITDAELKALMDRNEPGLVVIDSRSPSQYQETRIKGAINVPLADMDADPALPRLPKDARLVFYCSGNT